MNFDYQFMENVNPGPRTHDVATSGGNRTMITSWYQYRPFASTNIDGHPCATYYSTEHEHSREGTLDQQDQDEPEHQETPQGQVAGNPTWWCPPYSGEKKKAVCN